MRDSPSSQVFESEVEPAVDCNPLNQLLAGWPGISVQIRISPRKVTVSIDIIASIQSVY